MKGKVYQRKDTGWWYVNWWQDGKNYRIPWYKGERMWHETVANKLLSLMQSDVENDTFRIEKYLKHGWTDTVEYLWEWIDTVSGQLSPATEKDYRNSIKNHLEPFFNSNTVQLHEIQYDVLCRLEKFIKRSNKGKRNVMYCLHACLDYAWRSQRIVSVPPFPRIKVQEPPIEWLPEDRQEAIIRAIPKRHQPIFWWLKYHLRRPAEAMALRRDDYDASQNLFIVRRSISNRQEIDRTKTAAVHVIPCHEDFKPYVKQCLRIVGRYFFTNPTSRAGGRYTHGVMSKLWKSACKASGENIRLYAGLKHSSCSQYINQKGLSISDLQEITDHARIDSVKRYAKMSLARKRELMETKVIQLNRDKTSTTGGVSD